MPYGLDSCQLAGIELFLARSLALATHPLAVMLERHRFLIRERVTILSMADAYDILDLDTGEHLGVAREVPGRWIRVMQAFAHRIWLPTKIDVLEGEDESLVFSISRSFALFRPRTDVLDADGNVVGSFHSRHLMFGNGFSVSLPSGRSFAELHGDWSGRDFKFLTEEGQELGQISKEWGGLAKELFASASNYSVSLADDLVDQPIAKMLLLASALALDNIYRGRG